MKLLSLLLLWMFLLAICCATSQQQISLKRKRVVRDLSEKHPSLTEKHDGNEEHKRSIIKLVTNKPKAKDRLITPDMIVPQPLNLRIHQNYKPKSKNEYHGKKHGKTSANKFRASPDEKTEPVITTYKYNETDNHDAVTTVILKGHNGDLSNNKKIYYIEVDDNDNYINKDTDMNHNHNKIFTEHLFNRTEPDSQSVVTETTANYVKSNATSHAEKSVKKECDDNVSKTVTNKVAKSILTNNTDSNKHDTESTKPFPIAKHDDTENKIIKKENKIDVANNKTQVVKNIKLPIVTKSRPQKPVSHDNAYSAKFELNVDPKIMASIVNDPKDKIVIKNHDYEEVYERLNFGANSYQNIEPLNDYQNYVEPVVNTNEAYAPDTTFVKLPFKYPLESDIDDLCGIKMDNEFQVENPSTDVTSRDRIWRTWKNTEIYIKSNNSEPNISNKDKVNPDKDTVTTYANQMMPTTCSWYYSPQCRRYYYPNSNYDTSYYYQNYY